MGNVSSLVSGLSFDNMSADDEECNKGRLLFAYREYVKHDPNFFDTLTK